MTWEETIQYIRTQPEYKELVEKAYLEEDLNLNLTRFRQSEEFIETLRLLREYAPQGKKILDVGAGNGISSIAFALEGYEVMVIEPDQSETVGAGAIRKLAKHHSLANVEVHTVYGEGIPFNSESFDIVYARQMMHHAHNLDQFTAEVYRVLKLQGIFMTVRDHVTNTPAEKEAFLQAHPLQKFYNGENAFSLSEYTTSFKKAGFKIVKILTHFDSVINYFPMTQNEFKEHQLKFKREKIKAFVKKLGIWSKLPLLVKAYSKYIYRKNIIPFDEQQIPGRLYSFLSKKQ
ncbi:class I SAM-dependent methyltransferase [Xanthocytophaga flava]|uniref:class I SAM-dependent methyltransferase n=1 Tax=Xanthocytophaga flava TaxID=3048013 RepID=UPI0028D6E097|nr:class I SAM-dependent methyltransferase [Xanthocytophaga flavus]MDJ1471638.1 class I SAM-dependent methyltransferase [Xanthocytophaga flavus]